MLVDGNFVEIRSNGSKRVAVVNDEPSMTEQHHKQICDINYIVRRYRTTGFIDHVSVVQAVYGDFTSIGSYHESMNKLIDAQDAFLRLPSEVRKEFDNDPGIMLDAIQKPENYDKLLKLGLVNPRPKNDVSEPPKGGENTPNSALT